MKRANITTLSYRYNGICFLYFDHAHIGSDNAWEIIFVSFYVIWYALTAIFVAKNIYERKAELFIAVGFCIGFGIISYLQNPTVMMLIFPVLLSLSVYLNEFLIMWGAGATLVFIITKMAQILVNNPADKAEQLNTVFLVCICLIMCVFGGCKAIRRLIEFSNEENGRSKSKSREAVTGSKRSWDYRKRCGCAVYAGQKKIYPRYPARSTIRRSQSESLQMALTVQQHRHRRSQKKQMRSRSV